MEKGNTTKDCENSFDITNGESSPNIFEANINPIKKSSLKRNQLERIPKIQYTHPSHLSCAQSGSKPSMNVLTSLQRWARVFNFQKSLQGWLVIKTLLFLLLTFWNLIVKCNVYSLYLRHCIIFGIMTLNTIIIYGCQEREAKS